MQPGRGPGALPAAVLLAAPAVPGLPVAARPHGREIYLPGAVILGLLSASFVALWYRPRLGFVGLAFFLILAPTSSVIPIVDLAFEHRMYLPLAAVVDLGRAGRLWPDAPLGHEPGSPPCWRPSCSLILVGGACLLRTVPSESRVLRSWCRSGRRRWPWRRTTTAPISIWGGPTANRATTSGNDSTTNRPCG